MENERYSSRNQRTNERTNDMAIPRSPRGRKAILLMGVDIKSDAFWVGSRRKGIGTRDTMWQMVGSVMGGG